MDKNSIHDALLQRAEKLTRKLKFTCQMILENAAGDQDEPNQNSAILDRSEILLELLPFMPANDGQANDGQANDGQANDGQANDGQANDGQANDDQANHYQANDGQSLRKKLSNLDKARKSKSKKL